MLTKELEYNLPDERIAIYPPQNRGSTRLMVVHRKNGRIEHKQYSDLPSYLARGDVLVLNDTKVMRSRLYFEKDLREHEVLVLNKNMSYWEGLLSKSKKIHSGDVLSLKDDPSVIITIIRKGDDSTWLFNTNADMEQVFEKYGHVPIPPYMHREDIPEDEERYNTVFANKIGSAASPTASINLTKELFSKLARKGVVKAFVTLDVGWGTFAPIRADSIEDHNIHSEKINLELENASIINKAVSMGGRVISAGTTAARTLETVVCSSAGKKVRPYEGHTDIYIYPGYDWKVVDVLLTNFHAPRTSLLAMVGSFMGPDLMKEAYNTALKEKYSFLSYGDSMLIL